MIRDLIVAGIFLIVALLLVWLVTDAGSQWDLDRAGRLAVSPIALQYEAGLPRHSTQFLCEVSAQKWLKRCQGL